MIVGVIWSISKNTFQEIIRDRILYGLVIFAILLILLSLALGQLSFSEQTRITINFGLTGIHLSAAVLAIFVGSTLVSKEIDKKTVLTLLVRPITRAQFILGKFLGLTLIILSIILGLAVVMWAIFLLRGVELSSVFLLSLLGILLEAMILLCVSLFFSSFTRSILVVSFSMGVYLIGHWMDSLKFFADKSDSSSFKWLSSIVRNTLPNLEKFNWRSLVIYQESLSFETIFLTSLYALFWMGLFISLTVLVIRGKDFA